MEISAVLLVPYRTKGWREKSLANFTKSPNFIRQKSYNSTTIVSILTFSPNFIRQIDIFLHFRQTFLPPNFRPIRYTYLLMKTAETSVVITKLHIIIKLLKFPL